MSADTLSGLLFTVGSILMAIGFAAHLGHAVLLANGRRVLAMTPRQVPAFAGVATGSFVTAGEARRGSMLPSTAASPLSGAAIWITTAAWIALAGGALALVVVLLRRTLELERDDWLPFAAAALFVAPVAVDGFRDWSPSVAHDGYALTPGLVRAVRANVPERDVVFADLETSYRIAAFLPVYVANGPPTHVAATRRNDPYRRREDLRRFLRGDGAVLREYGATWLVLRRGEWKRGTGTLVYRDERFRVYRL
jgi:hypothetical protein